MTTMEERVSRLEGAYEQVERRLGELTEAVNALRSDMDAKFDALRRDVNNKFNTLIVVMATAAVGVAGALIAMAFRL